MIEIKNSYGLHASTLPNKESLFGEFGGKIAHPELAKALDELEAGFHEIIKEDDFITSRRKTTHFRGWI